MIKALLLLLVVFLFALTFFFPNRAYEAASCHSNNNQYKPPVMHIHSFTSTLTHTQTHNLAYTSLHHCHAASISPRGPPGSEPLSLATVQGSNHDWWPVTHMITHTHTANEQMHCCAVSTRANTSLLTLLRSAGFRQSVFVEPGMVFWCELVLSFQSATSRIQSPYILHCIFFFFFLI